MKAVFVNELGDNHPIIINDLPQPKRGKNQVLLKTIATTINPVDVYIRLGQYPIKPQKPYLLGRDVVAEVIETSKDSPFNVGDIVWSNSLGYEERQGVSAEILAVDEERLYLLPENVDPYQAVASIHATTTAVLLLTDLVKPKKNETILIQGGGGNVGLKLVELSLILGLDVTTTSSHLDFEVLTKLGSNCIDYNDNHHDKKYDYIIDTSGKNKLSTNVSLLNDFGKILMITKPKDSNFDAWDFYTNGKQILGFVLSKASIKQLNQAAQFINQQFEKGHFLNTNLKKEHFFEIKNYHQAFQKKQLPPIKPVFYYTDKD